MQLGATTPFIKPPVWLSGFNGKGAFNSLIMVIGRMCAIRRLFVRVKRAQAACPPPQHLEKGKSTLTDCTMNCTRPTVQLCPMVFLLNEFGSSESR